jgi:NADPH:quinone reductase-like Zn-dependent oxidoreductase
MPANLTFNQAAGLPIVFLTAAYALETLARVQRGGDGARALHRQRQRIVCIGVGGCQEEEG